MAVEPDSGDIDPLDSRTWPVGTIVVRGGIRDVVHLARVMTRDGSWSVASRPATSFEALCASVRHGTVRRTTVGRIRAGGGSLLSTPDPDARRSTAMSSA